MAKSWLGHLGREGDSVLAKDSDQAGKPTGPWPGPNPKPQKMNVQQTNPDSTATSGPWGRRQHTLPSPDGGFARSSRGPTSDRDTQNLLDEDEMAPYAQRLTAERSDHNWWSEHTRHLAPLDRGMLSMTLVCQVLGLIIVSTVTAIILVRVSSGYVPCQCYPIHGCQAVTFHGIARYYYVCDSNPLTSKKRKRMLELVDKYSDSDARARLQVLGKSGDVEKNPGPVDTKVRPDAVDVLGNEKAASAVSFSELPSSSGAPSGLVNTENVLARTSQIASWSDTSFASTVVTTVNNDGEVTTLPITLAESATDLEPLLVGPIKDVSQSISKRRTAPARKGRKKQNSERSESTSESDDDSVCGPVVVDGQAHPIFPGAQQVGEAFIQGGGFNHAVDRGVVVEVGLSKQMFGGKGGPTSRLTFYTSSGAEAGNAVNLPVSDDVLCQSVIPVTRFRVTVTDKASIVVKKGKPGLYIGTVVYWASRLQWAISVATGWRWIVVAEQTDVGHGVMAGLTISMEFVLINQAYDLSAAFVNGTTLVAAMGELSNALMDANTGGTTGFAVWDTTTEGNITTHTSTVFCSPLCTPFGRLASSNQHLGLGSQAGCLYSGSDADTRFRTESWCKDNKIVLHFACFEGDNDQTPTTFRTSTFTLDHDLEANVRTAANSRHDPPAIETRYGCYLRHEDRVITSSVDGPLAFTKVVFIGLEGWTNKVTAYHRGEPDHDHGISAPDNYTTCPHFFGGVGLRPNMTNISPMCVGYLMRQDPIAFRTKHISEWADDADSSFDGFGDSADDGGVTGNVRGGDWYPRSLQAAFTQVDGKGGKLPSKNRDYFAWLDRDMIISNTFPMRADGRLFKPTDGEVPMSPKSVLQVNPLCTRLFNADAGLNTPMPESNAHKFRLLGYDFYTYQPGQQGPVPGEPRLIPGSVLTPSGDSSKSTYRLAADELKYMALEHMATLAAEAMSRQDQTSRGVVEMVDFLASRTATDLLRRVSASKMFMATLAIWAVLKNDDFELLQRCDPLAVFYAAIGLMGPDKIKQLRRKDPEVSSLSWRDARHFISKIPGTPLFEGVETFVKIFTRNNPPSEATREKMGTAEEVLGFVIGLGQLLLKLLAVIRVDFRTSELRLTTPWKYFECHEGESDDGLDRACSELVVLLDDGQGTRAPNKFSPYVRSVCYKETSSLMFKIPFEDGCFSLCFSDSEKNPTDSAIFNGMEIAWSKKPAAVQAQIQGHYAAQWCTQIDYPDTLTVNQAFMDLVGSLVPKNGFYQVKNENITLGGQPIDRVLAQAEPFMNGPIAVGSGTIGTDLSSLKMKALLMASLWNTTRLSEHDSSVRNGMDLTVFQATSNDAIHVSVEDGVPIPLVGDTVLTFPETNALQIWDMNGDSAEILPRFEMGHFYVCVRSGLVDGANDLVIPTWVENDLMLTIYLMLVAPWGCLNPFLALKARSPDSLTNDLAVLYRPHSGCIYIPGWTKISLLMPVSSGRIIDSRKLVTENSTKEALAWRPKFGSHFGKNSSELPVTFVNNTGTLAASPISVFEFVMSHVTEVNYTEISSFLSVGAANGFDITEIDVSLHELAAMLCWRFNPTVVVKRLTDLQEDTHASYEYLRWSQPAIGIPTPPTMNSVHVDAKVPNIAAPLSPLLECAPLEFRERAATSITFKILNTQPACSSFALGTPSANVLNLVFIGGGSISVDPSNTSLTLKSSGFVDSVRYRRTAEVGLRAVAEAFHFLGIKKNYTDLPLASAELNTFRARFSLNPVQQVVAGCSQKVPTGWNTGGWLKYLVYHCPFQTYRAHPNTGNKILVYDHDVLPLTIQWAGSERYILSPKGGLELQSNAMQALMSRAVSKKNALPGRYSRSLRPGDTVFVDLNNRLTKNVGSPSALFLTVYNSGNTDAIGFLVLDDIEKFVATKESGNWSFEAVNMPVETTDYTEFQHLLIRFLKAYTGNEFTIEFTSCSEGKKRLDYVAQDEVVSSWARTSTRRWGQNASVLESAEDYRGLSSAYMTSRQAVPQRSVGSAVCTVFVRLRGPAKMGSVKRMLTGMNLLPYCSLVWPTFNNVQINLAGLKPPATRGKSLDLAALALSFNGGSGGVASSSQVERKVNDDVVEKHGEGGTKAADASNLPPAVIEKIGEEAGEDQDPGIVE